MDQDKAPTQRDVTGDPPHSGHHTTRPTQLAHTSETQAVAETRLSTSAQDQSGNGQHAGKVWGDYRLIRLLGKGGMGEVYLGEQVSLGRPVAIKVLPPDLSDNETFLKRFALEARSVAQLSHPNIIQVFSAGTQEGAHYFAMEFVQGSDLAQRLKDGYRPDHRQALNLVTQAALGLAAAARKGIIHRDIKPGNMMLSDEGVLKIMDFGLVRLAGEQQSLTVTGVVMGTAAYFSPEQGQGLACDGRTDIYALGVVFYELLTGQLPFRGNSLSAIIYQHITTPPPPPRSLDPKIPEDYQAVVLKCLQKAPEQRYASAAELAQDLTALAQGQSLSIPAHDLRQLRRGATIGSLPAISRSKKRQWIVLMLILGLCSVVALILFLAQEQAIVDKQDDENNRPHVPLIVEDDTEPLDAQDDEAENRSQPPPPMIDPLAQALERAEALQSDALDNEAAWLELTGLASAFSDHAAIQAVYAEVQDLRQQRQQAEEVAHLLTRAQNFLDMGDDATAEETFLAVLTLNPQATAASEGLRKITTYRARTALLVGHVEQALDNRDPSRAETHIDRLREERPRHPGLSDFEQGLQVLREEIAEEERQLERARQEEEERQRAAAAAAAQQRAIAEALQQLEERLAVESWNSQSLQEAETAVQALEELEAEHAQLAPARAAIALGRGQYQAQGILRQLDQMVQGRDRNALAQHVVENDYFSALETLMNDPALTYEHHLEAVRLNADQALSAIEATLLHALSIMPETRLRYIYHLQFSNGDWRIIAVETL